MFLGFFNQSDGFVLNMFLIVQLGPGLKSKTKALDQSRTINSLYKTTHHLPKTFRRLPGFVRGQDLVCRLPIDQNFGLENSCGQKNKYEVLIDASMQILKS